MSRQKDLEAMKMDNEDLGKRAFAYYDSGFCCSEAISKTIIERFAAHPDGYPVRIASDFCRGLGGSQEDICGALTGGVIAVGYLLGRMEPGRDISAVRQVVKEFRKAFIGACGSTNCGVILKTFGEQEKSAKCKALTMQATIILADLLDRHLKLNGVEPQEVAPSRPTSPCGTAKARQGE